MNRRVFLETFGSALAMSLIPWTGAQAAEHKLLGYLRTNWSQDPFSFGSYSYVATGAGRGDIKALDKPVGNTLFFAGEAANPEYNSTVHAAYESGLANADRILETQAQKVAIVGAGISGLAAAYQLTEQGKEVVIFEARDRIGGRIWTSHEMGFPLDLGASWIHGANDNPIYALAGQLDLETVKTDDNYISRGKGGRRIADDDLPNWLEEVVEIQHSAGADLSQLNQKAYWFVDDYDGDEVIFPQGYGSIVEAARDTLDIQLNSPVEEIHYDDNGVEISIPGQASQGFDAALVTVPLGVLKHRTLRFVPDLPQRKQQAIERLGMGTLDKVYLHFEKPFWDQDATWIATPENDLPQGQFNQWLNLHKYIGKPVIMAFNGGPPALELAKLSDEEVIKRAMQTLLSAYPS